jgi:uncharacterized membrane protein YoaK (UPF0700 family)
MKWTASVAQIDPPRWMPPVLATIAGFVDACTFVGLFGLFVAQLTGSYVVAGASMFAPGWPEATVLLAVPMFFAGGVVATLVATTASANRLPALACALGLETALLAGFAAIMMSLGPLPVRPPEAFAAALLGLAAMGAQSALVRLMLRGVASTNVMTTNTTQIAIEATQAALSFVRRHRDPEIARQHAAACRGLARMLPLPLGFSFGVVVGAFAFAAIGRGVVVLPALATAALTVWALRTERAANGAAGAAELRDELEAAAQIAEAQKFASGWKPRKW